jgi:hypothetical protein
MQPGKLQVLEQCSSSKFYRLLKILLLLVQLCQRPLPLYLSLALHLQQPVRMPELDHPA